MEITNMILAKRDPRLTPIPRVQQPKTPGNSLIIPIKVDFLFVDENDPPLAQAKVNFSYLPYNDGKEDINSGFAYVSENFISQPFQNANLLLKPGLHLHWAFPDAFTSGTISGVEDKKQVTHKKVPDRWIINRKKNGTIEKSWIVESNYLHPEGKNNKYHAISYPIEVKDTGQPFRYMGRSYLFYDSKASNNGPVIPQDVKAPEYLNGITVVGYGEHTFAAFYPNCHSVFGFCDPEIKQQTDLAGIDYEILGWYSNPTDDPVREKSVGLNFDGTDDHVHVTPGLPALSELTIESWIYPGEISNWDPILNYDGWEHAFLHYQFHPNGQLEFSINGNTPIPQQYTSLVFEPKKLYHIATVYSSTEKYVKFYVNGNLIDIHKYDSAIPLAANIPFKIGAWIEDNRYFKGSINELRVWRSIRTQEEIQLNMNIEFEEPQPELVAYYKFDQGAADRDNINIKTLLDSSGNARHGELKNFALSGRTSNWTSQPVSAITSGALDFDGIDDHIEIGSGTGIPIANSSYTIEAFIKPAATFNGINGIVGWGNYDLTNQFYALWLGAANESRISWWINDMIAAVRNLAGGNWHHIAVTYDSSNRNIYLDGVLRYSDPQPVHNVPSAQNFRIGSTNNKEYFNGSIAEVRIWNVARTQAQIRSYMHTQFDKPQTNLVAYYKFDQAISAGNNSDHNILFDSSGNNNHGSIKNFNLTGTSSNWVEGPPSINLAKKLKINFNFRLNTTIESLTTIDSMAKIDKLPIQTLCYANLKFNNINTTPSRAVSSIAIGHTSTEAMSTWLSNSSTDLEDELNALQQISKIAGKKLDIDAVLEEAFHEKGFLPVPGGHAWRITVEAISNNNKSEDKKQGIEIRLPDSFAYLINDLNQLQQAEDKMKDELRSLEHQLYADWCKYMIASYHPDIEKGLPQADDIRFFIRDHLMEEIKKKHAAIKEAKTQKSQRLKNIYDIIGQFNFANKYGNYILNSDGTVNINESQKYPFSKLITEQFFSTGNATDPQLEGIYVRNFTGINDTWESRTQIPLTINNFKAVSFWVMISSHQPVDTNNADKNLIQINALAATQPVAGTDFNPDVIGRYWQTIYINGEQNNPFEPLRWKDLPKDQWIHIYLAGSSVLKEPINISLFKGLKGSLASIRVFNADLTPAESFCDMNMLLLKKMKLSVNKGSRYWLPTEPVVLIAGDIAKPSGRYGFDDELPCILFKTDDIDPVDISEYDFGITRDEAAFRGKLEYLKTLPAGIRDIGAQILGFNERAISTPDYKIPWNPLILEWKVAIIPLEDNATTSEYSIPQDLITQNYFLKTDYPDLTLKQVGILHDSVKIFSGSTILTPHAKDRMMEVIEKYLESLNENDDDWILFKSKHPSVVFNPFINHQRTFDTGNIIGMAAQVGPVDSKSDIVSIAVNSYQKLSSNNFLSQSLGGFNAAMMMLHQAFQLPIADPLGFDDDQAFAVLVKNHVKRESKFAPLPLFEFDPIRTGTLSILELNIIDSFGQIHSIYDDGAEQAKIKEERTQIYFAKRFFATEPNKGHLLPRISQPARINFRWLSANTGIEEMNDHPVSSTVCGWLVPNNLEDSIMVYDQYGDAMGAIEITNDKTNPKGYWRSVPGSDHPVELAQLENSHLKDVIDKLIATPDISDLIELLERIMDKIDPENFTQHTDLAMLIGRPIAIVRAAVGLEVKGNFAINQDWASFEADMNKSRGVTDPSQLIRTTNDWEKIKFPVRIGEHGQLNDGVVGYWLDDSPNVLQLTVPLGDPEFTIFIEENGQPKNYSLIGLNTNSKWYDKNSSAIQVSLSDEPVSMTLLMDPRGAAHAICGVLPVKSITIPDDQFKPSLKKMSMTFFTRPLLIPEGKVAIPLPDEPGYNWSWLVKSENKWKEYSTIGIVHRETFENSFKNGDEIWNELIDSGWIEAIENNKAIVVPASQRKKTDAGPLVEPQLSRVLQLLDDGHIVNVNYMADFTATNQVREGWLKLTPEE